MSCKSLILFSRCKKSKAFETNRAYYSISTNVHILYSPTTAIKQPSKRKDSSGTIIHSWLIQSGLIQFRQLIHSDFISGNEIQNSLIKSRIELIKPRLKPAIS